MRSGEAEHPLIRWLAAPDQRARFGSCAGLLGGTHSSLPKSNHIMLMSQRIYLEMILISD
jgi:hypothetical protein